MWANPPCPGRQPQWLVRHRPMNEFPVQSTQSPKPSLSSPEKIRTGVPLESTVGPHPIANPPRPAGQFAAKEELLEKPIAAFLLPAESFESAYGDEEKEVLTSLMNFVGPPPGASLSNLSAKDVSGVEVLFTGWDSPKLDVKLLSVFSSLRMVFHAGGSVKFLLTDQFWQRGVRVTCTARANAIPVAEFTFAHIILALKHALRSAQVTRESRRFVRDDAVVPSCYRAVVGIISAGLIGRMVIERLRQLEIQIVCYDPFLSAHDAAELGVTPCTLDEVFLRSDVVSCHTPLLPETTHLLRERHFASMKPYASFINTARGAIVHESELIAVLSRRPDLFAVLDVTDPEPPLTNSLLFALPNVVLTPHISGSIGPECRRMGRMIVDEVRHYLAGTPLRGEILRDKLPLLA
jgi:phosphoglycerate dehydrogenase-like enzyme